MPVAMHQSPVHTRDSKRTSIIREIHTSRKETDFYPNIYLYSSKKITLLIDPHVVFHNLHQRNKQPTPFTQLLITVTSVTNNFQAITCWAK